MAPKDFGVKQAKLKDLEGVTPEKSAELMFKLLYGIIDVDDPKREIVQINGAAAIIVGGKADGFGYGIELAKESIESGKAYRKLKELVKFSGGDLTKLEELETKHA
jgi:anthranilate phosphoribosyltransferase